MSNKNQHHLDFNEAYDFYQYTSEEFEEITAEVQSEDFSFNDFCQLIYKKRTKSNKDLNFLSKALLARGN